MEQGAGERNNDQLEEQKSQEQDTTEEIFRRISFEEYKNLSKEDKIKLLKEYYLSKTSQTEISAQCEQIKFKNNFPASKWFKYITHEEYENLSPQQKGELFRKRANDNKDKRDKINKEDTIKNKKRKCENIAPKKIKQSIPRIVSFSEEIAELSDKFLLRYTLYPNEKKLQQTDEIEKNLENILKKSITCVDQAYKSLSDSGIESQYLTPLKTWREKANDLKSDVSLISINLTSSDYSKADSHVKKVKEGLADLSGSTSKLKAMESDGWWEPGRLPEPTDERKEEVFGECSLDVEIPF